MDDKLIKDIKNEIGYLNTSNVRCHECKYRTKEELINHTRHYCAYAGQFKFKVSPYDWCRKGVERN